MSEGHIAVAAIIGWLVSGLTSGFVYLKIRDQIEAGVPLDQKLSWKILPPPFSGAPWRVLQAHRRMFPQSRLRFWALILYALSLVSLILGISLYTIGAPPQPPPAAPVVVSPIR